MKKQTKVLAIAAVVVAVVLLAALAGDVLSARLRTKPIYGIPLGGPAPAATADSNYSFAFTGDTRNNDAVFDEIIRESMGRTCAFGIYGGDLVANSSERNYKDFCESVVKTTGGKFPIYPVIGNHDWGTGVFEQLEGARFERYLGPRNYSFRYGPDAFVLFDDSQATGFTAKDAAAVGKMIEQVRPTARNLFLICHIPPYDPDAARAHCLGATSAARLLKLAAKYKTTMLLCSHVHGFGARTLDGVRVLISGGAGAKLVSGGKFNWVKIDVDSRGVTTQMIELPQEFQTPDKDTGAND